MPATIAVIPVTDRESRIEQADPSGLTLEIRFRGKMTSLPRKVIGLDLPNYRMLNIRTGVVQRDWARAHGLARDYFLNGQEDQSVQTVQHGLLIELAKDSKANIYDQLESDAEQSEPLLITHRGVVLNGNRRLAAMRELFASDPSRFKRYEHIDVAVLPDDATEDDLAELETDLQIRRELKLEYGWVEQALGLRYQTDPAEDGGLGWDMDRAARHWGEQKKDLLLRLNALETAEAYLAYVGKPEQYAEVDADEQAFATFQARRQARAATDPTRLDAEQSVFFASLAEKDQVGGRVYDIARSIDGVTTLVLLQAEPVAPPEIARSENEQTDPLGAVLNSTASVRPGVLSFLADRANAPSIATWAGAALDVMRWAKRAAKTGTSFQTAAQQINSVASGLVLAGAFPATIGPAATQLIKSVVTLSEKLLEVATAHPEEAREAIAGEDVAAARRMLEDLASKLEST